MSIIVDVNKYLALNDATKHIKDYLSIEGIGSNKTNYGTNTNSNNTQIFLSFVAIFYTSNFSFILTDTLFLT